MSGSALPLNTRDWGLWSEVSLGSFAEAGEDQQTDRKHTLFFFIKRILDLLLVSLGSENRDGTGGNKGKEWSCL